MQIYNIFKRLRFLQNIYSKFHIYRDFFWGGGLLLEISAIFTDTDPTL